VPLFLIRDCYATQEVSNAHGVSRTSFVAGGRSDVNVDLRMVNLVIDSEVTSPNELLLES